MSRYMHICLTMFIDVCVLKLSKITECGQITKCDGIQNKNLNIGLNKNKPTG